MEEEYEEKESVSSSLRVSSLLADSTDCGLVRPQNHISSFFEINPFVSTYISAHISCGYVSLVEP